MPNINILVADKIATNMSPGENIVCGNSNYTVTFDFDSEWDAQTQRTARFVYYKNGLSLYQEATFTGNTVAVPVLSSIDYVLVGVYAGSLTTTTPAKVLCDRSILCGDPLEELTHEEKAKLQAQIGDLSKLCTTAKTDLVAAINEVLENGKTDADGKSIFFYPEDKKVTVGATFHITSIQKGDSNVSVGDLILAASGWLYQITSISGNLATASFLSVLGMNGTNGSSIHHVFYSGTAKEDVTVGAIAVDTSSRNLNIGDLLISNKGLLYEYTGKDKYGNLNLKYLASLAYTFSEADKAEIVQEVLKQIPSSGGGLNITDDGNGNVTIASTGSVSITDDGNGNVTIG